MDSKLEEIIQVDEKAGNIQEEPMDVVEDHDEVFDNSGNPFIVELILEIILAELPIHSLKENREIHSSWDRMSVERLRVIPETYKPIKLGPKFTQINSEYTRLPFTSFEMSPATISELPLDFKPRVLLLKDFDQVSFINLFRDCTFLTSLAFHTTSFLDFPEEWNTPLRFPHLKRLELHNIPTRSIEEQSAFIKALSQGSPKLDELALSWELGSPPRNFRFSAVTCPLINMSGIARNLKSLSMKGIGIMGVSQSLYFLGETGGLSPTSLEIDFNFKYCLGEAWSRNIERLRHEFRHETHMFGKFLITQAPTLHSLDLTFKNKLGGTPEQILIYKQPTLPIMPNLVELSLRLEIPELAPKILHGNNAIDLTKFPVLRKLNLEGIMHFQLGIHGISPTVEDLSISVKDYHLADSAKTDWAETNLPEMQTRFPNLKRLNIKFVGIVPPILITTTMIFLPWRDSLMSFSMTCTGLTLNLIDLDILKQFAELECLELTRQEKSEDKVILKNTVDGLMGLGIKFLKICDFELSDEDSHRIRDKFILEHVKFPSA